MVKLKFDIETTAIEENEGIASVNKAWCISILDVETNILSSYNPFIINEALEHLSKATELIGHNIIGFDLPVLRQVYDWEPNESVKITDTLVQSRTLNPDRRKPANYTGKGGPHSLEAWGYRGGETKPEHEDWSRFSPAMLRRNRKDVEINLFTYNSLQQEMKGHSWDKALEIEHKVRKIITQQEINGVRFDTELARSLTELLERKIQHIDDELVPNLPVSCKRTGTVVTKPFKNNGSLNKRVEDYCSSVSDSYSDIISGPFSRIEWIPINLGSMVQVKNYLLDSGWIPTEWNYNDDGQRTSPKLTEDSYGTITHGFGKLIKDRLLYNHRKSQIQGWIERVRSDGRISATANTCGTNTGRFRHSGVVNVPKAKDHIFLGKEMRSCFTCGIGRKLVGYDASGLELRMLAHYMDDPDFTEAVVNGREEDGTDIHTINQHDAGLPTRDDAKTFIYAFNYGAGNPKLGNIIGGTEQDGARLKNKFLKANPSLVKLIKNVKRASKKGYLKGLDGRKVWMRRDSSGKVMDHKALNTLLQSAGAIVMKQSMIILDKEVNSLGLDAVKVIDMHDESQFDVRGDHVEQFCKLAENAVKEAGEYFNLRVPLSATAKVGLNWRDTH